MVCLLRHPKKHKASPQRRGWAARATKRPGSSGRGHRQGGTKVKHPKSSAGVAPGRDGPSRKRRLNPPIRERPTDTPPRQRGDHSPCASDRNRQAETQRGSAANAVSRRARSRPCREAPY